jgi:hypothetical protein
LVRRVKKGWLFAIPALASSVGWATIPAVITAHDRDLEGALFLAGFAGLAATLLTAPLTIVVLGKLGALERISLVRYIGLILLFSIPALAFETYAVSASAMGLFVGGWVVQEPEPWLYLLLAGTFAGLYAGIGLVSFPLLRRDSARATPIAVAVFSALMLVVVLRFGASPS